MARGENTGRLCEIIAAHFKHLDIDDMQDHLSHHGNPAVILLRRVQQTRTSEESIDAKRLESLDKGLAVLGAMMQTTSFGLCPTIINAPRNTIRKFINLFMCRISGFRLLYYCKMHEKHAIVPAISSCLDSQSALISGALHPAASWSVPFLSCYS